jgi:uncharacterized Zn finger protein
MLEVAVAEVAEPGRLRRGRAYARQGAVVGLDVRPGLLVGRVQGSEHDPYEVLVRVPVVAPEARPTRLVPSRRDLKATCSCPDDDSPCKHAVAVLTEFARRLSYDPGLLHRWRTGSDEAVEVDDDRLAARRDVAAAEAAERATQVRSGLEQHLGHPRDLGPTPSLPMPARPVGTWDDPFVIMLTSALDGLGRRG